MLVQARSLLRTGLVVAAAVSLSAAAQDAKQQVDRVILERHAQTGVAGKEIVVGTVTLAPGAVIGFHRHPGDEVGYIVTGSVVWKVRGQPDKTLKAGDSFFNPRGSVHSVIGGDGGATAVATWIVDKGPPLAEPVK
jgi:quercetin dioxygenase-like cupin family protein